MKFIHPFHWYYVKQLGRPPNGHIATSVCQTSHFTIITKMSNTNITAMIYAQSCWKTFQYKFICSSFIIIFHKYSETIASSILITENALWPHNLVKWFNYDYVWRSNSELNTLPGNLLYLISYKFKLTWNCTDVSEQLTLQFADFQ
jgi:hypothetical protein